ncbi:MAG: Glu-tRNA(Gln) amidotransferase subunit GatD, partial [Nitrosopumilus sp.]
TISGRVDYRTGAIRVDFGPEELISMYPELEKIANFNTKLVGKMWSEDMRFAHHIKLAKEIEKEVKKGSIKGIILPHGTDTMTYTSASLAFMLENLPIPVLLVGAQRSPDRASSDAVMNLICASEFIAKTDFKGIGICMHESSNDDYCVILPPTKTRKLHTSRRDAFKPVNDKAIARINYKTREIKFLKPITGNTDKKEFIAKCKLDEKVALLKVHPNLMPDQILFFKKNKYKGLVLEGTGLGQIPVGVPDEDAKINSKNLKAIKKLIESGCVVVMTSQCIFGRVQMHVYEGAVDLVNAGVIPGEDMLSETAFVKLAWLLGNYPKEKVAELMTKNLRGEINEATNYKEGFVLD